jgi:hypothetical protein
LEERQRDHEVRGIEGKQDYNYHAARRLRRAEYEESSATDGEVENIYKGKE